MNSNSPFLTTLKDNLIFESSKDLANQVNHNDENDDLIISEDVDLSNEEEFILRTKFISDSLDKNNKNNNSILNISDNKLRLLPFLQKKGYVQKKEDEMVRINPSTEFSYSILKNNSNKLFADVNVKLHTPNLKPALDNYNLELFIPTIKDQQVCQKLFFAPSTKSLRFDHTLMGENPISNRNYAFYNALCLRNKTTQEIIGLIHYHSRGGIESLKISDNYQGKNYGSLLLAAIIELNPSIKTFHLKSTVEGLPCYFAMGFVPTFKGKFIEQVKSNVTLNQTIHYQIKNIMDNWSKVPLTRKLNWLNSLHEIDNIYPHLILDLTDSEIIKIKNNRIQHLIEQSHQKNVVKNDLQEKSNLLKRKADEDVSDLTNKKIRK